MSVDISAACFPVEFSLEEMTSSESTIEKKPLAKTILVIRYRFIGDTILTVPFLRNLRAAYPHARIDVLTGPKSGEVLDGCPYIDSQIIYDTTRFHKYDSGSGKARSFASYVLQLRQPKYDLVFVLKRSLSSSLLAFLTGAKRRVGYAMKGKGQLLRNLLLTDKVAWREDIHEVDSLLSVLEAVGIAVPQEKRALESWVTASELATVNDLGLLAPLQAASKKMVLIHAAAAHPDKLYPLASWAALIKRLHSELDLVPVFSGDTQDMALYEELAALSGLQSVAINFAGLLSLRESMALYSLMSLAVCVDSGPAHLCAAAQVPTIAIFGPTDPVRWQPYGEANTAVFYSTLPCRPCNYHKVCHNRECLTELSPDLIFEKCLNVYRPVLKREQ
ncbi:glycosyltransferase family 9 protein [bacterium]|nr:glycosyltransferase family 9 protein [bacterium]